ncbi:MAG: hypothetical protein JSS75_01945 [Bacteroidetes bacterium]|nr:hypothetical protein [Bacteroidota bacterium]
MVLKDSFEEFKDNISLNDTRVQKIMSAHNSVRDWLEGQEAISALNPYTFLQGSYASDTAVKPQNDGSFDVDVVIVLDLESMKDAGEDVIASIAAVLSTHGTYKDKIIQKKHCVRLDYADEFHLDITPANRLSENSDPIEVANDWHLSHPKGLIEYCRERQKYSGGYFYGVVRLFKWWRNLRYGDEGSPKSIILLTLVGMHIPAFSDSLNEAFVDTLRKICAFLDEHDNVPELSNPSIDEELYEREVISRSWSMSDYREFKSRLNNALTTAERALLCRGEQETIDIWNGDDLFIDTFPKKKHGLGEKAKEFAEAASRKALTISSAGVIAIGGTGRAIPHVLQYGDSDTKK